MSARRLLGEQVAQPAHGVDRHLGAFELLAQARDVDLDRLHARIGVELEHLLEQRLARHRTADARQQGLQHRQLARGQRQRLAVHRRHAGGGVELEPAQAHQRHLVAGAAQQGLDARLQFGELEGFRQIIVGAEVETLHALLGAAARGQHQHRGGRAAVRAALAVAQAAQHLEAIEAGQRQVEDRQVVALGAQGLVGVVAAAEHVQHEAGLTQRARDPFGEFGVVLDQQQAHRRFR